MVRENSRIRRNDFKKVLDGSRSFFSPYFTLNFKKTLENKGYFSVVVSKMVAKNATKRNLVKRRIYGILRKYEKTFKNKGFFIIYAKKPALLAKFGDIEESMKKLLISAKIIEK